MDQKHDNIFDLRNKKSHLFLMERQLNKLGAPLDQQYCELKYITLACITEYIAARLVTIQILHFTGDKVKIPAVKKYLHFAMSLYMTALTIKDLAMN
jgi:hypothetical protein